MNNPLVQPDPGLFFWTILTFLVLLWALRKFAWKPLLELLESRENLIRTSLDDAEKARVELESLQEKSQEMLTEARAQAQSVIADGKVMAEKLREDILEKAREKADAIVKNAELQIEAEKEKVLKEIKSEIADMSISIASKLIGKNLSTEDNAGLIKEALKSTENLHEA